MADDIRNAGYSHMTPIDLHAPIQHGPHPAVAALRQAGHNVEPQDVPGLYRIDGGPELTMGQVVHVARQIGVYHV